MNEAENDNVIAIDAAPAAAPAIAANQARVNVTYGRANGDLPDPVFFDASPDQIKEWVTEAIRGGDIPGIPADPRADLTGFVVEPFAASAEVPHNRIFLRPKTEFGELVLS
jgi:hypothetical protein